MMLYEKFREQKLDWYRKVAGLDDDEGDVQDVIDTLIKNGKWSDAVELIFCRERQSIFDKSLRLSYVIFMVLWCRVITDAINLIAQNHYWSETSESNNLSIEVYPGEFLIIPNPISGQLIDMLELTKLTGQDY